MNQIINYSNNLTSPSNEGIDRRSSKNSKREKFIVFLKLYFFLSISILLISLTFFLTKTYNINKNEKISKQLINSYDVSMLYSNLTPSTSTLNLDNNFSVIGLLEIKKINLKYPILSNVTDYLLQIAPCRFYGPMANEIRKFMCCCSQL